MSVDDSGQIIPAHVCCPVTGRTAWWTDTVGCAGLYVPVWSCSLGWCLVELA